MKNLVPILAILVGESLAIYSEIIAAKNVDTFLSTFWKMIGLNAIAGVFLITGYMLGIKYLQNIWVVGAISIASIVIAEPFVAYLIFHELPTKGPIIGFALGILAILAALFIK
jgi:hypothetical protein